MGSNVKKVFQKNSFDTQIFPILNLFFPIVHCDVMVLANGIEKKGIGGNIWRISGLVRPSKVNGALCDQKLLKPIGAPLHTWGKRRINVGWFYREGRRDIKNISNFKHKTELSITNLFTTSIIKAMSLMENQIIYSFCQKKS